MRIVYFTTRCCRAGTTATRISCAACCASCIAARPRRARVRAAPTPGASTNLLADHGEAALDALRARLSRRSTRPATTPSARPRRGPRRRRPRASCTSGTTRRWSPRIGAHRARGRRASPCCSTTRTTARSATPTAMRRLRPARLRRRARLRRGAARRLPRLGLGAAASGPGTRRPTRALFRPPAERGARAATWSGSATGATASARAELRRVPARARSRALGLPLDIYGVRYPDDAQRTLAAHGVALPRLAAQLRARRRSSRAICVTVHVPRRFYVDALPGIPTIRVFEALACGIPLVCAPWDDAEGLFRPARTILVARDGAEMTRHLRALLPTIRRCARALAARGLATIRARHTCAHRVDELLAIAARARRTDVHGMDAADDRLLRLEPGVRLLERRGHLLPRHAARAAPSAAIAITFYEPDAFDRQQHRDIDPPTGRASSSTPRPSAAAGATCWPRRAPPTSSSRRAASACSTTSCSSAACSTRARPGALRRLLGRRRRRPRSTRCAPTRDDPLPPRSPRLDLVLTYGGGAAGGRRLRGARRARAACRSTTRSIPRRITRCRADPRFAGDLAFLGNRLPDREARVEEFFLRRRRRAAATHASCSAATAGTTSRMPANVALPRPRLHARPQRASTARRARCSTSRATAWPRSASRRRRACSRRPGAGACLITDAWEGIELFLEPEREVLVAARRRRTSPSTSRAHARARRARSAQAARAPRPGRAHLRAARRRRSMRCSRGARRGAQRAEATHEARRPRPVDPSSWGNGHATTYRALLRALRRARPRRPVPRARRALVRRPPRPAPAPTSAALGLYDERRRAATRFAAEIARRRRGDRRLLRARGRRGRRWVQDTARGVTAFYDIDTPVTLAKLARGDVEYLAPALDPAATTLYLSFTGGPTLDELERDYGSPPARPLYCSVDPDALPADGGAGRWDLGYLGTYSDDRQPTLERLLLEPARRWPRGALRRRRAAVSRSDRLAGQRRAHRRTWRRPEHPGFYSAQRFTLNVTRADMIAAG